MTSVLRKITQSAKNNKTYCFSTKIGPNGWCATCKVGTSSFPDNTSIFQPGAKRGERGFCHHTWAINETLDIRPPENPDEVAWPNSTEVSRNFRSIKFSQLRVGDSATSLAKKM